MKFDATNENLSIEQDKCRPVGYDNTDDWDKAFGCFCYSIRGNHLYGLHKQDFQAHYREDHFAPNVFLSAEWYGIRVC